SKVWLNAETVLRFSSRFGETDRRIELDGEAYFEVSPSKVATKYTALPFFVKANGQEIAVLGTAFNVSAYNDDLQVKTTLVDGRVKISCDQCGEPIKLEPGQQSIRSQEGLHVGTADVSTATA